MNMKYMKSRLLALGLVISLTASLTACGGNSSKETNAAESSSAAAESSSGGNSGTDIPNMEVTIPLNDVTLAETTAAPESEADENGTGEAAVSQNTSPAEMDMEKVIALTFDDGPDTRDTSSTNRILDVLEQYGVKATFFVQGQAAQDWLPERNKATVQRESDLGMEIGTHTYSHADLRTLSADGVREEISKGKNAITDITGGSVDIMRPPYGETSSSTQDEIGLPMILWDVDTLDWDTKDANNTAKVILEQAKPGSIILMHDIYNTTADAVEIVVPQLIEKGYTLVTVSELFSIYGTELKPGYYYTNATQEGTLESPFSRN